MGKLEELDAIVDFKINKQKILTKKCKNKTSNRSDE